MLNKANFMLVGFCLTLGGVLSANGPRGAGDAPDLLLLLDAAEATGDFKVGTSFGVPVMASGKILALYEKATDMAYLILYATDPRKCMSVSAAQGDDARAPFLLFSAHKDESDVANYNQKRLNIAEFAAFAAAHKEVDVITLSPLFRDLNEKEERAMIGLFLQCGLPQVALVGSELISPDSLGLLIAGLMSVMVTPFFAVGGFLKLRMKRRPYADPSEAFAAICRCIAGEPEPSPNVPRLKWMRRIFYGLLGVGAITACYGAKKLLEAREPAVSPVPKYC